MQKRSSGKDGSWVCTIHPEDIVRKGCQQFTTLSKMITEFGTPHQYFMLITKAFDNMYPYLLHADGQSVSDPDADQPPPFCYQIVSDPSIGPGYLSWGKSSSSGDCTFPWKMPGCIGRFQIYTIASCFSIIHRALAHLHPCQSAWQGSLTHTLSTLSPPWQYERFHHC